MSEALSTDNILPLIQTIRSQRVILAADLAKLYGVRTLRLNEAVKRNKVRFPSDFVFQLTRAEALVISRSQIAILNGQVAVPEEDKDLGSQSATLKQGLNSPQAVAMSVYIVRAFVQQRDAIAANDAILKRLAEIDQTLLLHDEALRDIYQKLLPLLQPPSDPPRPQIGFREAAPKYGRKSRRRF
jgi:hypothetical protein